MERRRAEMIRRGPRVALEKVKRKEFCCPSPVRLVVLFFFISIVIFFFVI